MLHLYAVAEPGQVVMRSHSFRAMQEVVTRLMLMNKPFSYHYNGYNHVVEAGADTVCVLGPPKLDDRVIVGDK